MSESKLSEQQARGNDARHILEHPLVKEAFEKMHQSILDAWENSPAEAEDVRQNAYLMQRLLKNFREQFSMIISNGKMAEKELLHLKDPSKIRRLIDNG